MNATQLTCEYAQNPIGIDTASPRFGWTLDATGRGANQTAYRILVASSAEQLDALAGDKWDSGKVESGRSVNVAYEGEMLASSESCWWKVCVWDAAGIESWSEPATFEMGLLNQSDWTGTWIGAAKNIPSPWLRKEFEIPQGVVKARLYVSGVGWSESYIDGKKISDRVLDPCASEYGKSVYYVTHDVTDSLQAGTHAIGLWMGNGWFSEPDSTGPGADPIWNFSSRYGDSPRAIVQLHVELENGESLEIVSDESWKSTGSCITQNNFYYGERYDARLEQPGWCEPNFDDASWSPATQKDAPGGVLRSQLMPPIRVVQTRKPIQITEPKPGVYVCHFDQLFGGWLRLRMKGDAGARVEILYSEQIYPESGLIDKHQHEYPKATDSYILKGLDDGETYEPRFTYHPVGYVQIEGLTEAPTLDDIDGCIVHTDEDMSGEFECSDGLINTIHSNATWTLTNGLYGMPLDCLYREHWAWTDPASITGTLYPRKHMPRFWTKWLRDIADCQREDGSVPVLVPDYKWSDWHDPAWGGNYPQLVWYLYQHFNDERLLEEHYDGIRRTVDHLTGIAEDGVITKGFWGDHMLPGTEPGKEEFVSSETARGLVWTGYYYRGALAVAQAAEKLGRCDDATHYAALASSIRNAYNRTWLDSETGVYDQGSQTSQAFPLALGIVPDAHRQTVIDALVHNIRDVHDGHHHTGNTGTTCLMDCLVGLGYGEILWTIAAKRDYPSWGYMIQNGATTIWESWCNKSSTASNAGAADSMIMWATIERFFINDLAGIGGVDYYSPVEHSLGLQHLTIAPFVPDALSFARGSVRTVHGRVTSHWRRTEDGLSLEVTIPGNCTATIRMPKLNGLDITVAEGDTTIWQDQAAKTLTEGITAAAESDDHTTFEVGSGHYVFTLATSN